MHLMPANRRAAHLHLQTLDLPHPPAHTHVCMRTYACAHPTITPSPPHSLSDSYSPQPIHPHPTTHSHPHAQPNTPLYACLEVVHQLDQWQLAGAGVEVEGREVQRAGGGAGGDGGQVQVPHAVGGLAAGAHRDEQVWQGGWVRG